MAVDFLPAEPCLLQRGDDLVVEHLRQVGAVFERGAVHHAHRRILDQLTNQRHGARRGGHIHARLADTHAQEQIVKRRAAFLVYLAQVLPLGQLVAPGRIVLRAAQDFRGFSSVEIGYRTSPRPAIRPHQATLRGFVGGPAPWR